MYGVLIPSLLAYNSRHLVSTISLECQLALYVTKTHFWRQPSLPCE